MVISDSLSAVSNNREHSSLLQKNSNQKSRVGYPSYRKGGQQSDISGQWQRNFTCGADGWMDIGNIDRCRPAGAWVWGGSFFYTDVAPLGLRRGRYRITIDISPRWGNQSSVCSRAIYRTFFLGERRTHRACLLPCIASTVRSYRRTATSGQESGFGDPSYKKGSQQSGISGWEISAGARWDLLSRKTGEVGKPRQQNGKICCEEQITASVRKGQVAEVCSPA